MTMADVARIAGVSTQTVSRALNNTGRINAETRQRVLQVVDELGYLRNAAARTLVNRRSGIVGIVMSDADQYSPRLTMLNVESALRVEGYGVSLASYVHGRIEQARATLWHLAAQGVEAVILIGATPVPLTESERAELQIPVVSVRGDANDPFSVGIDQVSGATLATEYLLARGHRSVLHIGGPETWLDSNLRETGWRAALDRAGKPAPVVEWRGDWTARGGYEIGRALVQKKQVPNATAIFVANDQMAMGLCRAFFELEIRVPQDVSIVGFDDLPEASYYNPPLTTVRQDLTTLGSRAARLALTMIADAQPVDAGLLPPTLVTEGRVSGG